MRPRKLAPKIAVGFIQTMECLPVANIPVGADWTYEIKLDGYRLEAVKSQGAVTLYSCRKNVLNAKFVAIVDALTGLRDDTILDGSLLPLMSAAHPASAFAKLPHGDFTNPLLRLRHTGT